MATFASTNDTSKYGTHWHCRIHEPTDKFVKDFVNKFTDLEKEGFINYVICSEEIGEKNGKGHLHAAFGTAKSENKYTLAARLGIRPPNGRFKNWYLSPIYTDSSPRSNWEYCEKGSVVLSIGEAPEIPAKDEGAKALVGAKREKWIDMINLAKEQEWEILESKYPYEYICQGSKLRALYFIQHEPKGRSHAQHLWIYGPPGTGKSCVVEYLFPNHYKKRADNDWLGYNPVLQPGHSVVYLPDFDVQSMRQLRAENLKVMCDPQGFNANKKFAGGDIIAPGRIVITSNFRLGECFPPGYQGVEEQKAALRRRFREVYIDDYLKENNLKLKPKEDLNTLMAKNNFDWSKCFNDLRPEIIDLTEDDIEIKEEYEFNKKQRVA